MNKDNDRGIHASSVAGDPSGAEGAIAVNTLTAPGGFLGQPTSGKSRQDIPVGGIQNSYPFRADGVKELLGQNPQEGLKDDNYPSPPNVALAGASGTTNRGQQGSEVDWASVAPYEYPEFPAPGKTSPGNINDPAPLT